MHSTLTALLEVTYNWYLRIDDGLLNSVLLLDLKKTFDTVDHSILLKRPCNFMASIHMQFSNISGGARERRRREPPGGSGGMLPQKSLKPRGLEMLFPAFSKSYL